MDLIAPIIIFLVFACWLLPLMVIGFAVAVRSALRLFWHERGLEEGVIYCANCRFDLRGTTDVRCSECGTAIGFNSLLVRSQRAPLGLGFYVLSYFVAGFTPIVLLLVLLGSALPMNYQLERSAELDVHYPQSSGHIGSIWMRAVSRDGYGGPGDAPVINISLDDHLLDEVLSQTNEHWNGAAILDWRDEQALNELFDRIYAFLADDGDDFETRRARDDFVSLCQAIGKGNRPARLSSHSLGLSYSDQYHYADPHPLFIISMIGVLLFLLYLLDRFAKRQARLIEAKYTKARNDTYDRFQSIVETNRAGLPS